MGRSFHVDSGLFGLENSKCLQGNVTLDTLRSSGLVPDIIFHCAGGSSVPRSVVKPEDDFTDSIESTRAVVQFVREYAPNCKIVYSSSAGIYGDVPLKPIPETQLVNPCSPYGYHKYICENLLEMNGKCFGVNSIRIRFFSIYGEGLKKQILWDCCNKAVSRNYRFSGTGEECRDLIYIDDAVELMITAAANADQSCPILNGGVGLPTTIHQIVSEIRTHFPGCPAPEFNGISRAGDPKYFWADTTKSNRLGWIAVEKWENGIKRYCDWYKGQNFEGSQA